MALSRSQNPNPKTKPSFQDQLWSYWLSYVHISLSLRLMQECLSLENKLDCHGTTDLVDHGAQGPAAPQALYHTLTRPNFGQKPCPVCNNQSTEPYHFEHLSLAIYTLCQFWVHNYYNQSERRYFLYMPSISCILYPCDLSPTLHLVSTSCYAMLVSYASTVVAISLNGMERN